MTNYAFPMGGLPGQNQSPEGKAIFTTAYAVIPADTMRDIVTSFLPGWVHTRAWVLARPLSGFAETFAQLAVELAPGGGSNDPEPDKGAEGVLFMAFGEARLTLGRDSYELKAGSYVYLPPAAVWTIFNTSDQPCGFHWVRKKYKEVKGIMVPEAVVTHETDVEIALMPGTEKWGTQRFADPLDLGHDMHVNIVTFQPGGRIPFAETHVMEHGLYVLEGTAEYLLNDTWVSVGPGDFMWLRAFCPQACIATGDGPFRYLLYKDVNRHPELTL